MSFLFFVFMGMGEGGYSSIVLNRTHFYSFFTFWVDVGRSDPDKVGEILLGISPGHLKRLKCSSKAYTKKAELIVPEALAG